MIWLPILIVSVIVAFLVVTSISYIAIVHHTYKVSQAAQQGAGNQVQADLLSSRLSGFQKMYILAILLSF